MEKDFDSWNIKKKAIHHEGVHKFYHEREVWWCALGVNVGSEQDGTGENNDRPVLILRGVSKHTCIIVPLTSSQGKHRLGVPIGTIHEKNTSAILSQMRIIDIKRLLYRITYINQNIFISVQKAAKEFL